MSDVYGRAPWKAGRDGRLRAEVEALGVDWERYRSRRRLGQTHEQAMTGVDRRKSRRGPCCPTCGHRLTNGHEPRERKG